MFEQKNMLWPLRRLSRNDKNVVRIQSNSPFRSLSERVWINTVGNGHWENTSRLLSQKVNPPHTTETDRTGQSQWRIWFSIHEKKNSRMEPKIQDPFSRDTWNAWCTIYGLIIPIPPKWDHDPASTGTRQCLTGLWTGFKRTWYSNMRKTSGNQSHVLLENPLQNLTKSLQNLHFSSFFLAQESSYPLVN